MQLAIIVLSIVIFWISLNAYFRRRSIRYALLSFAFLFLFLSQIVSYSQTLVLSGVLLVVPYLDLPVSYVIELATMLFFFLAIIQNTGQINITKTEKSDRSQRHPSVDQPESRTLQSLS